ncbi:hypothetical protein AM493_07980 [Flavobacterium akiainvivens]|uniref:Uncharacterized protein n=1 Tax=Flavobacterium akiainvivens TaxID=1202724 RepID=A0A0M8MGW2_9FLAO|nr:hypothetical protein [Flavobacterium akiainvivens]KOS05981.1 hypothetical protein AM493_07980 [Flavobacterium akiainvivens]SFQ53879.1 hypothetical protein SAMN05444144_10777 [Flavobacterium akiainvivens]
MKNLLIALATLLSLQAYSQTTDEFYDNLKRELEVIKALNPPDGKDKQVWDALESINQEVLQGDSGEITEETASKLGGMMQEYAKIKNAHLLILFQFYQANVSDNEYNANLQSAICKLMLEDTKAIYGTVPCLVLIYECETLMSIDKNTEAAEQAKKALKEYPESIPLQIYRHNLTTDEKEKKELHDKLLKEHPNHWMVNRFLKP